MTNEAILLNFLHTLLYQITALNVVGATTNITLRSIQSYTLGTDAIGVRKFGKEEARRFKREAGQACECGDAVEEMIVDDKEKVEKC